MEISEKNQKRLDFNKRSLLEVEREKSLEGKSINELLDLYEKETEILKEEVYILRQEIKTMGASHAAL